MAADGPAACRDELPVTAASTASQAKDFDFMDTSFEGQ
jgi:hypothetical protein